VEGAWRPAEPPDAPVETPVAATPVADVVPIVETAPAVTPPGLLASIEAIARETGSAVSRAGDWVRIAGARRSLRAFPSEEWVDLQLVGLDEGTMVGLRYRHGVPLRLEAGEGAPPGVHLRVRGDELGPAVEGLIRGWLTAPGEGRGEKPRPAAAPPADRPPRNARR
jgi:hypothetical protein